MRDIDPELQTRLDGGATTLCRCWRVTRKDGNVLGFTDHDADVTFQGQVFEAASGFDATGIEAGIGLSVDNSDVVGALSSAGISDADIAAGRFDEAAVDLWVVDWQAPHLGFQIFKGNLGEIRRGPVGFEAELRSLSEKMNKAVGRNYLPTCDAELGDARCGFDATHAGYTVTLPVDTVVDNRVVMLTGGGSFEDGWFSNGFATWHTGANAGVKARVKRDQSADLGRRVELWLEATAPVLVGDELRLVAGCDGRAETCRLKFSNMTNFRGFPHMPGEDFVTAYPAAGGVNDGGSLNNG